MTNMMPLSVCLPRVLEPLYLPTCLTFFSSILAAFGTPGMKIKHLLAYFIPLGKRLGASGLPGFGQVSQSSSHSSSTSPHTVESAALSNGFAT